MTTFQGIFTPLVTPIQADESPDLESLGRLVRFQIEQGVQGLWAMGTSAEFASFSRLERAGAVAQSVKSAAGRVWVIANVSDASTRLAIEHGRRAKEDGADAIAATPPYYFPHSQDELLDHYRRIRQAVDLPLFIYNIPQTVRTKVELTTAERLAEEGTVAGIKDSQNDLEYFRQLTLFAREKGLGFTAFAGTRYLIDAAVLAGAHGAIPSIANAFPDLCVQTFLATQRGDFRTAADVEARVVAIESQASLVKEGSRHGAVLGLLKAVLHDHGIIASPGLTSPLRNFTADERRAVVEAVFSVSQPLSAATA